MTRFDPVTQEIEINGSMVAAGVNAIRSEPYENRQRMVVDILAGALSAAGFKPVAEQTIQPLWSNPDAEPVTLNTSLWND